MAASHFDHLVKSPHVDSHLLLVAEEALHKSVGVKEVISQSQNGLASNDTSTATAAILELEIVFSGSLRFVLMALMASVWYDNSTGPSYRNPIFSTITRA